MSALVVLFAVACEPGAVTVLTPGSEAPAPTEETDATEPTEEPTDPADTEVPDNVVLPEGELVWEGVRTADFYETADGDVSCTVQITEEGEEITEDSRFYEPMLELCPDCDALFYVEAFDASDSDCGVGVAPELLRGLKLDPSGEVEIVNFGFGRRGELDVEDLATGTYAYGQLEYAYQLEGGPWDRIDFAGTVQLEATPEP